jgi:hypothetical protein
MGYNLGWDFTVDFPLRGSIGELIQKRGLCSTKTIKEKRKEKKEQGCSRVIIV